MTAVHIALIAVGYVIKAALTVVLWRRFGPRVRSLGRLARRRRTAGQPVLARATPGHLARTFRLGPPTDRSAPACRPPGRDYRTTATRELARTVPTTVSDTA